MDDIYKNIEECNPNKKRKILIIFDDIIADMLSNKKLNLIETELFIRVRKLSTYLVLITQSYFAVPKNIRLNSTYCFIMKIPNKQQLLQKIKKCTAKSYSFLVIDATLNHIILYVWEIIMQKEYKKQSWQWMIKLEIKNYNAILTEKHKK